MAAKTAATIEDLYNVPDHGKAEIVDGKLVLMSPTGSQPGLAAAEIYFSLRLYKEQFGGGTAFPDNIGFIVDLPHRKSFSPDAAWYVGNVEGMGFLHGSPIFAVEVRSENDYGPRAERAIVKKIMDYFAAGTQVVWDVDLLSDVMIKKYTFTSPEKPTLFRQGEVADAEPAVPAWKMPVDRLLRKQ